MNYEYAMIHTMNRGCCMFSYKLDMSASKQKDSSAVQELETFYFPRVIKKMYFFNKHC